MKLLFVPVSVGGGLVAGAIASRVFQHIWSWFDEQEPPDSSIHRTSMPKLLVAAAIEGAIFRVFKSVFDHSARRAFLNVFGSWPGQEEPEAKP
jgi:hypothetical protein